jgi:vacuolar-type H+-ATPase subunit I/STV1
MPDESLIPPGMSADLDSQPKAAAPPPPKKPGLFAPKPKQGVDIVKSVSDLAGELNNLGRRMMVLEERYTNLRKKTDVTDQNMLSQNKKVMTEIHTVHEEIDELKKELNGLIEKMKIIVRELKECAKHEEVEVLQKYINLWQPINFVTREVVLKLVASQVEAQFKDLNIRLQQEEYIKEQIRIALNSMKERA